MCANVCSIWTQKLWNFLWFLKSRSIYGDFFFPFNLGFGSYMPTFVWFLGIGLKPKMDMPWLRITSFFLYLHTELIVLALRLSFMVAIWDFYCFPINANPLWSVEDYPSLLACSKSRVSLWEEKLYGVSQALVKRKIVQLAQKKEKMVYDFFEQSLIKSL